MLGPAMRLATSVAISGAEMALESGRVLAGDDALEVRPRHFRRLLLSLEDSIQGRIPDILGDDGEERVDTLVRLLRGTSEQDMTELIESLSIALERLRIEGDRDRFSGRRSHR
jgi:hypothetical protein